MPKFLVLAHGGIPPKNQEERDAFMGRWMSWFTAAGQSIIDPGAPFLDRTTIGTVNDPTSANGYMIIRAGNLAKARQLAETSPAFSQGSGLEIMELREMATRAQE